MRRLTAAVYLVGSAVCLSAVVIGPDRAVLLGIPMLLFLAMGIYNLGRGKDDDKPRA